jgi:hypothetical protein
MENHIFTQGVGIEYELPVNDPQVFSNIFFWTLKATCIIVSDTAANPISVKMLRKTGSVNDTPLTTGDSLGLIVQPGDKINITAVSGAKVELVNHGNKTIKASCTANS